MNAWRRFVLAAVFLALSGTVIWAEEGKHQTAVINWLLKVEAI